jgi:indolepyruvate ferredoxin oxidoreductase alpha subunit
MGASIGVAVGLEQAGHENTVAIIGDSTFIHAGIPPLIDAVYNRSRLTLIILDNSTTGMTGSQPNPCFGQGCDGAAPRLKLTSKRCAAPRASPTSPSWIRGTARKSSTSSAAPFHSRDLPSSSRVDRASRSPKSNTRIAFPFFIHEDLCTQCDACFKVWCPAITRTPQNFPVIAASECTSCTVCAQVCPTDAIKLAEETA